MTVNRRVVELTGASSLVDIDNIIVGLMSELHEAGGPTPRVHVEAQRDKIVFTWDSNG